MSDQGALIGQMVRHAVGDAPFFVAFLTDDGRLQFVSNIDPKEHQQFLQDCLQTARTHHPDVTMHEYHEPS